MSKKSRVKILYNSISAVIFILVILLALFTFYNRASGRTATVLGYNFSVVVTPSMDGKVAPVIKVGDFVAVKKSDISKVKKGDVVLYRTTLSSNINNGIERILHKVESVNTDDDGIYLTTKGTANDRADDEKVRSIIGIYKFKLPLVGRVILFYKNPINIIFTMILLVSLYISVRLIINITAQLKKQ